MIQAAHDRDRRERETGGDGEPRAKSTDRSDAAGHPGERAEDGIGRDPPQVVQPDAPPREQHERSAHPGAVGAAGNPEEQTRQESRGHGMTMTRSV